MAYIHGIETANPPYAYRQEYAATRMKRWVRDRATQRMVHAVYRHSGIEQRHSVLPDFQPDTEPLLFRERDDGTLIEPTTGARNQVFQQSAGPLCVCAADRVLKQAPWIDAADITHLITVSCTGFCNPGPDFHLVQHLGLSPGVERYHLGFMGCYAAFPALRMARQFCEANPAAVVLVVCVELCSLHLQVRPTPDSVLANALFADGAAAALVSARPLPTGAKGFRLDHFATRVLPDSEQAMAWTVGDHGFDMVLSSYVPKILSSHAPELLRELLAESATDSQDVAAWAVHPGGKAILTGLASSMGWEPNSGRLRASHEVLRDYGNMSSATILFVLKALLQGGDVADDAPIGALAFGPGLTVEFGMLRFQEPASVREEPPAEAARAR